MPKINSDFCAVCQMAATGTKMFVQMTVLEIKNSGKADKCKEKHGFPAGVQKCAEPQKMENPTRNLTILRGILVRSRELESLAL